MANFRVTGTNKGLRLDSGDKIRFVDYPSISIYEFSNDTTLADASATALVTEYAIKAYVDAQSGGSGWSIGATPPASPSDGTGWYNTGDGILYIYDGAKWLSAALHVRTVAFDGNADGDYLTEIGINDPEHDHGVICGRDITIKAICLHAVDGNASKGASFEIDYVWQEDFTITNYEYVNATLNYDIDAGENFQVYIWSAGTPLKSPVADVGFRFRYTAP
jgi:hypothetical protein